MRLAHIAASASALRRRNSEWTRSAKISSFGQVLPQCNLNDCGERRASFLRPDIDIYSFRQIVGNSNGSPFHGFDSITIWCNW